MAVFLILLDRQQAASLPVLQSPRQTDRQNRRYQRKSGFFLRATMINSKFAMASSAKKPETSFETAMERLEKIVEEMESGKMLLEDLLVRYEEGMKLVKVCQDRLAQAEGAWRPFDRAGWRVVLYGTPQHDADAFAT